MSGHGWTSTQDQVESEAPFGENAGVKNLEVEGE